jgi:hypothetical protein
VRTLVMPHLRKVPRVNLSPWRDVLAKEGLHGRYLHLGQAE